MNKSPRGPGAEPPGSLCNTRPPRVTGPARAGARQNGPSSVPPRRSLTYMRVRVPGLVQVIRARAAAAVTGRHACPPVRAQRSRGALGRPPHPQPQMRASGTSRSALVARARQGLGLVAGHFLVRRAPPPAARSKRPGRGASPGSSSSASRARFLRPSRMLLGLGEPLASSRLLTARTRHPLLRLGAALLGPGVVELRLPPAPPRRVCAAPRACARDHSPPRRRMRPGPRAPPRLSPRSPGHSSLSFAIRRVALPTLGWRREEPTQNR